MLIVEDMEGICRLWVDIFYVSVVHFVTLLYVLASLTHISLVACHACELVDSTSVVGLPSSYFAHDARS
jgi:hypothetical protein